MPLNCMEAHFLSRKLLFGSFQKTYGSQTPPVLNLYFLEALFACSFFTVWFLPLLENLSMLSFRVVFSKLAILTPFTSLHIISPASFL